MALKDITNEILDEARKKAERIAKEGEGELVKIAAAKDEEIIRAVGAVNQKAKIEINRLREQAEFRIRTIKKNAVLRAKQDMVDRVFKLVKERLAKLNGDNFVKLAKIILKKSPKVEDAKVVASKSKKNLVVKALRESGLRYKIAKECLPAGQEGFILKSDVIEVNNTIASLVDGRREDLGMGVAQALFKD